MSSVKEIYPSQRPERKRGIYNPRNSSLLSKNVTKRDASTSNNARGFSENLPSRTKVLKEKVRLPLAHAPEGAEFHRRRFSYVQCRNQSSQTEFDSQCSNLDANNKNEILKESLKKDEEQVLETQLKNILVLNEEAGKTDRSSHVGNERKVKKKPFIGYQNATKPEVVDPDCPPGHQTLSEEERLQMLEQLHKSYELNLKELNKLPICVDTLRVKLKRAELDNKLKQIEMNTKIFAKPKVYVKIDS